MARLYMATSLSRLCWSASLGPGSVASSVGTAGSLGLAPADLRAHSQRSGALVNWAPSMFCGCSMLSEELAGLPGQVRWYRHWLVRPIVLCPHVEGWDPPCPVWSGGECDSPKAGSDGPWAMATLGFVGATPSRESLPLSTSNESRCCPQTKLSEGASCPLHGSASLPRFLLGGVATSGARVGA